MIKIGLGLVFLLAPLVLGFVHDASRPLLQSRMAPQSATFLKKQGGGGFGKSSSSGKGSDEISDKTYGSTTTAAFKDVIDVEAAMNAFFSEREDWHALFRSMATSASVPAMQFLGGTHGEEIDFHEESTPWKRLNAIPTEDNEREHLASFLDNTQQSLLDIPVDELNQEEDEYDLHFLEEGRRLLVVSRFHVLPENSGGTVESFDHLFSTCWNELAELSRAGQADTGSLILLPDYDLADLRRFIDMNIQRPLLWLGMDDVFEVASMKRGSPAIRLIHKLSDMPTEPWNDGQ